MTHIIDQIILSHDWYQNSYSYKSQSKLNITFGKYKDKVDL